MSDRTEAENRLMAYALQQLARWSDQASFVLPPELPPDAAAWLAPYRALLGQHGTPPEPGDPLLSIFSRVRDPAGQAEVPSRYWRAEKLKLDEMAEPCQKAEARLGAAELEQWWQDFGAEAEKVRQLPVEVRFGAFTHLLHKWAWAVPCSTGEPGVSFYDEFRALSALVFASGCAATPAAEFLLVGGDIPGIQQTLYTITSKGAAKGLRGRSFFLQLLGDAMVRRLLAELDLPAVNVIYAAGGNFMLLAPAGTEGAVDAVREEINRAMLDEFEGDLSLALAWEGLPAAAVGTAAFAGARERLGHALSQAKNHPFLQLATGEDGWRLLFETKESGGTLHCQVCQREPPKGEKLVIELDSAGNQVAKCAPCRGFEVLAREIAPENLWLVVTKADETVREQSGWQGSLARLTGFSYRFVHQLPETREAGKAWVINKTDMLKSGVYGFRFVANVTPRKEDGTIRTFEDLAQNASGLKKVGVLRMDVDGLGQIFSEGLPDLTLPQLSALSWMLDLFFSGYLNVLVQEQADNDLYIIYAGGDDLFIVGAWHRLPDLAESIRKQFKSFVGDHPALSLSGGLTLENPKFPLYRAAERAEEAEGKAKGYTRPNGGRSKDAFCFLGTVVGWEDWDVVSSQKQELLWLIGEDEASKAGGEGRVRRLPRALLQTVQGIHRLYHDDLLAAQRQARRQKQDEPDPSLFYGRWMWMRVYSLTQMAVRNKDKKVRRQVKKLQNDFVNLTTVRYSGLAARWAEYLTRKEERS